MSEKRVGSDFEIANAIDSSKLTFLDLPFHVRRRIYATAHLVRFCPVDMNSERHRVRDCKQGGFLGRLRYEMDDEELELDGGDDGEDFWPFSCRYWGIRFAGRHWRPCEDAPYCVCPSIPFCLFLISRAISDEVLGVFYSENKFMVTRSSRYGLLPLKTLGKLAWTSLTSLSIRLNSCSCHCNRCKGSGPSIRSEDQDSPLDCRTRQGMTKVKEWCDIADKLSALILPCRLTLDLTIDVRDADSARLAVQPLMKLPSLKNCSIRLGEEPDREIQVIACDAMSRSTDLRPAMVPRQRSKYLPDEIMIRILEYSELAPPFDLQWCPELGRFPRQCCKRCTSCLQACACPQLHSASSSTCLCWRFPTSLFLVSRRVRDMAYQVFYQRNHFRILPFWIFQLDRFGDFEPLPGWDASCDLLTFLTRLPSPALRHLRHVQWTVPPMLNEPPTQEANAWYLTNGFLCDWVRSLNFLAKNANLSKLDLELDFHMCRTVGPRTTCKNMIDSLSDDPGLWDTMAGLMIKNLPSVRNLFIHICCYEKINPQCPGIQMGKEVEKLMKGAEYDSSLIAGKNRTPVFGKFDNGISPEDEVYSPDGSLVWPPKTLLHEIDYDY